jgi:GTPase SAR1 family protein
MDESDRQPRQSPRSERWPPGSISTAYYRPADGILLVFDVALRHVFDPTTVWMKPIPYDCRSSHPIDLVLVGDKLDLELVVTVEGREALAKEFEIHSFERSVEDRENVDAVFPSLTTAALKTTLERAKIEKSGQISMLVRA